MRSILAIAMLCLLGVGIPAYGDWPSTSDTALAVVIEPGNQWNVHLVSDGKNGAILVWQDRRNGLMENIYTQRISAAGVPQWQSSGIRLSTTVGNQYYPQIVADGVGGAVVAWQDNRYGTEYDIFAQRIASYGVAWWGQNGLLVCNAAGQQYNPQVVPDGVGGFIIAWQDRRSGQYDIYAQRLNPIGQAQWATNGYPVCAAAGDQVEPKLVADGKGGAFVVWTDYRSTSGFPDVYCQHIMAADGHPDAGWPSDGVPVCIASNTQWNPQIVLDGSSGVIIVWQDRRNGLYDNIYAQRVDQYGQTKWAFNGIPIAPVSGIQYYPRASSDGSGGMIVVWQDNRRGNDYDIYAQRVKSDGSLQWATSGLPVCSAAGNQYNPQLVVQSPGAIVVWQDKRNGSDYDIYGQYVLPTGQAQWTANGVPISLGVSDQFMPQIASDSIHGAIVAWTDYRRDRGESDIFANRVGANGMLAGGCYRTFVQDSLGVKAAKFKRGRRLIIGVPNAGTVRDSLFGRGVFPDGICIGVQRYDQPKLYGWLKFTRKTGVRYALPQLGTARPFNSFVGRMQNPSRRRYNNRIAGELLALKLNIAASDYGITPGQFGNLVYKDTGIITDALNNKKLRDLAARIDTLLTMWIYYRSTNWDQVASILQKINGAFVGRYDTLSTSPLRLTGVSSVFSVPFLQPSADPPSLVPAVQPLVNDDIDGPESFLLRQNYPNPFNPSTTIEFILPEPAIVTMQIYNLVGQVIQTPIDHVETDDGDQAIEFDASHLASGVYFYRIIAEPLSGGKILSQARKMVVVK